MKKPLAVAALVALVVALGAAPASAHITILETDQTAGEFTILTLGVPHGCDEAGTTKVEIQIPKSVIGVTPTLAAGWTIETVMEPLAQPIEDEGETINERVAQVVYTKTGEPLPHDRRDKFELSLQIPEDAGGTMMFFPTVQTCSEGETAWVEIPETGQDPFELESPAPFINVAKASAAGEGETATTTTPTTQATASGESAAAASSESDDSSNGLAIAALVIAIIGVVLGGIALARRRAPAA